MGDGRIYDYIVVVCVVMSIDGMIVDWVCILWDVLEKILVWIVNEVDYVNCVVYDIMSKLLVMVEWE